MENEQKHLEQLREIRSMMERSSRFISLSGLSGVFAGFFALMGAAAFYTYVNNKLNYGYTSFAKSVPVDLTPNFITFCILDAGAIVLLSLSFAVFFTTRNAKRNGQTIWDRSAKMLLVNLAIPLIAGGVYCLVLLQYGWFGLIAPTTLVFYGVALVSASKYTLDEIRWLGISEIILGIIGLYFIGFGITLWAIGFGVLHIIYGLMMYVRYETKGKPNKFW